MTRALRTVWASMPRSAVAFGGTMLALHMADKIAAGVTAMNAGLLP